jgi:hypothetical protein
MKLNVIAILSILLAAGAFAVNDCDTAKGAYPDSLSAAEHWYSVEEYQKAGDCYRESQEWGKCVLAYLKTGRISEGEWDLNKGPISAGSIARTMYDTTYYPSSGLGSDMGKCLFEHKDTVLIAEITAYKNWMDMYVVNGGNPPFDMDSKIVTLEAKEFPAAPAPQQPVPPAPAEEKKPVAAAPPAAPTAPPKQQGFDMGMIVMLALALFGLVLLVVVGVAAYFLVIRKKSAPAPVQHAPLPKHASLPKKF